MGLIELILVAGAFGVSAGLAVMVLRLVPATPSASRAPLRVAPLLAGGGCLLLSPLVALAGSEWLAQSPAVMLMVQDELDAELASASVTVVAGMPFVLWLAAPALSLIAVALASSRRRSADAFIVAGFALGGATAGLLLGLWLAQLALLTALSPELDGISAAPRLLDTVAAMALFAAATTVAGAAIGAVGPAAALTRRSRRVVLLCSTAAPALLMGLSALATPPDVISQVVLALPLGVLWLLALGVGSVLCPLRKASGALPAADHP